MPRKDRDDGLRLVNGRVGAPMWVAYVMEPLAPKGIGPFRNRVERDNFFATMHRTHPFLVGKRVDCLEEIVPLSDLRPPQRD